MPDIDDRWHTRKPRLGVKPCREHTSTKGPLYPTGRHGIGRRWSARWRDAAKKQCTKSFEKKPEAEQFLDTVRADLARGAYVDPRAGKETVRAYAARWLAMQTFDPATYEATERRIRTQIVPYIGDLELSTLLPSTVQAWVKRLSTTYAPGTVHVTLGNLSTILAAAVEDKLIASNPCKSSTVRDPGASTRKITPWSVERVRAVAARLPDDLAAVVPLGAGTGMRQGEIFGLPTPDVDFIGRTVHVRRQVKRVAGQLYWALPKGEKVRDTPLPRWVAAVVEDHLRRFPPVEVTLPWLKTGEMETVPLVFTVRGRPVDRILFTRHAWKTALLAAGVIPKRTSPTREHGMHVLRHSYASTLLAEGVDIRTVSEYLGHSNAAITLRVYSHLMPRAEDRARDAIDRVFHVGGAPDVRHATV